MAQSPRQKLGMEDVLDDLNAKILDQCRRYLGEDKIVVDEYSKLDIDEEIDQLNPTLWKAILHADEICIKKEGDSKQTNIVQLTTTQKKAQTLLFVVFNDVLC